MGSLLTYRRELFYCIEMSLRGDARCLCRLTIVKNIQILEVYQKNRQKIFEKR